MQNKFHWPFWRPINCPDHNKIIFSCYLFNETEFNKINTPQSLLKHFQY